MPKFVIERQYLVPMYQHIVVEAETLEEACKKAISDDIDWQTQEMDCDSARATTITAAKVVPEGYEADQVHRTRGRDAGSPVPIAARPAPRRAHVGVGLPSSGTESLRTLRWREIPPIHAKFTSYSRKM